MQRHVGYGRTTTKGRTWPSEASPLRRSWPWQRNYFPLLTAVIKGGITDPACHSELADPMYLVPVSAAGVTDLMMLDTRATKTILSEDSNIARAVGTSSEPGPRTEGLAGDIGAQRMVRDIQLQRGGRVLALSPSIAKPSWPCKAQGLLGMDALRSCVMILGDTEVALTCEGARAPDSAVNDR